MSDHEDGGADVPEVEHVVDDSKLKLPTVKLADGPVATHEEDEEETFRQRGKLSRLADGEWKQRGLGDIRLLKHKVTGRVRLVMRQEKTLKLVANHVVDPVTPLQARPDSDQYLVYKGDDYSEGELKPTTYLLKVKDGEAAAAFTAAYNAAREANAALPSGSPAKAPSAAAQGGAGGPSAAPAPSGADAVPVYSNLSSIYTAPDNKRYETLAAAYTAKFGKAPEFFVRAPGRVNLIGEHIDYHGYSVLPCALEHDVVIAVGKGPVSDTVSVGNANAKYASGEFPADPSADVDRSEGLKWWQYVQCGYKGAFDAAAESGPKTPVVGVNLVVDGKVPASAGVSSSSALVVASTLAVARANGIPLTRTELAEAARKCELYIGTMGGGMDQAISCLAEVGKAQHIEFDPLRAHPVTIPEGGVIVVANSLVEASKAVDAATGFNRRVTEGKLAAKLIAKKAGVASWASIQTILELQKALGLKTTQQLLPLITAHLKPEPYTLAELQSPAGFGVSPATLFEGDRKKAGALDVLSSGKDGFLLFRRARHVATEAQRVLDFRFVCETEPSVSQLPDLGALMSDSHTSCRDDYECSAPDLDVLVELCKANGAFGARLTGAGWGGCAVALVPESNTETFLKAIEEGFYSTRPHGELATVLFASKPAGGAAVYIPN